MKKIINFKEYELNEDLLTINPMTETQSYSKAWIVNPGHRLGNQEYVFDSRYSEYLNNPKQLYFLHIPRTSGMSIKHLLMKGFSSHQIYSNFIQHINDQQMSGSIFVSGHFGLYPIELAKKNNQSLISYTRLRDPLERYISNFLYTVVIDELHNNISKNSRDLMYKDTFNRNAKKFIQSLFKYSENKSYDNVQSKHLTHTVNLEVVSKNIEKFKNGEINKKEFYDVFLLGKDLVRVDGVKATDTLNNITLVDIVSKSNNSNISNIIQNNFNVFLSNEDYKTNSSFINAKEFIKIIPNKLKNNIITNNQEDYELYEHALKTRL